jgi:hypothetical protein
MQRLTSLALLAVASLGSTGCASYYCRVRHGRPHVVLRAHPAFLYGHAAVAEPPAAVEVAAPQALPAAPPTLPAAPPVQVGPGAIYVHVYVPGTTIIVINPPAGGPAVVQQTELPVPQPAPQPPKQESSWFDDD